MLFLKKGKVLVNSSFWAPITAEDLEGIPGTVPPGGDEGQVLKKNSSDDYDAVWSDDLRDGINPEDPESIQSGTFTAVLGVIHLVDSSGGPITADPPAAPAINDRFGISDATASAGTNNITIDFTTAGQNLYGSVQDYILNVNGGYVEFIYMGATTGWIATK